MHIKFLARGTGSARAAADYLLGARDATGQPREGVEVLRGDPHRVAAVADALAFEHKYTSGVIAWAPADTATDEQIGAVIDAFEQTAWAGLEPDRYAWAAVVHRERDGGVHVHVLAARCDLETGRSLNIAPPGWQTTFDPLRDAFNAEHGWSRPDDPARARVQQPGHRAYVEAAHLRAGLALEPAPRDLIRDYLLQRPAVEPRRPRAARRARPPLQGPRHTQECRRATRGLGPRWRLDGRVARPVRSRSGEIVERTWARAVLALPARGRSTHRTPRPGASLEPRRRSTQSTQAIPGCLAHGVRAATAGRPDDLSPGALQPRDAAGYRAVVADRFVANADGDKLRHRAFLVGGGGYSPAE